MFRFAVASALLALISIGVPHLAHAEESKHFEPGHFAMPSPSTRATLSIDQRELTVEHGRVELRLWVHNPTRRNVQTSLYMPLADAPDGDSKTLKQALQENYAGLSVTHDGDEQRLRTSTAMRDGQRRLSVVWSAVFPAHRTVQVTVEYPFLYERHEVDQRESWAFEVPGAASNAWAGRIHYNRFKFCDSTIVRRVADFGGDTRAWNASHPEYYRDYTFEIRPGQYRLDRYGKCMLWETENQSPNGEQASFEVAMSKQWEKLTPFVPPGVDDEQAFLVRVWCAGGRMTAAPMWNREHLADALGLGDREFDDEAMDDAVMTALSRAHGGATDDQLDKYWSELPPHIRHKARIRLLEYARAYLGKRTDAAVASEFARACTGNVERSMAPAAVEVENRKKVDAMLAAERAAYESAWRGIEEKY